MDDNRKENYKAMYHELAEIVEEEDLTLTDWARFIHSKTKEIDHNTNTGIKYLLAIDDKRLSTALENLDPDTQRLVDDVIRAVEDIEFNRGIYEGVLFSLGLLQKNEDIVEVTKALIK